MLGLLFLFILTFNISAYAQDKPSNLIDDNVELSTTYIKGNKELPNALYIVPWQKIKSKKITQENLQLHSLFGDIFQPSILSK